MTERSYPFALPVGTDISGYIIESVIGAGGFGITYRARNPVTGVTVAIKEFYPQGLASRQGAVVHLHADVSEGSYEAALHKFEQEAARLTGRYRHPNIVRGMNFLRANHTAYFVMEFIEGVSLDVYLNAKQSPPDELELRHIFEPIFEAVDYIHRSDGMHRDLTPRNIMIRKDGTPILVDFGAAGEGLDTERPYSTAFAQPNYAPPEQIAYDDGRMQGRHTDIFSLAGVLYRCVTGQPPARPLKRSQEVSIHGAAADPYVPLAEAAPHPELYQRSFFTAIDRALRLDYRERPASIGQLRQMLGWDAPTAVYQPDDGYDHHDAPTIHMATGEVRGHGYEDTIALPAPASPMRFALIGAAALAAIALVGAAAWMSLEPSPRPVPKPAVVTQAPPTAVEPPSQPKAETPPAPPAPPPQQQVQPPPPVPAPPPPPPPPPPPQPKPPAEPAWPEVTGTLPVGTAMQSVAGVEAPKADQCQKACRDDRSCVAFAIQKQSCTLYTAVTGIVPDATGRMALRPGSSAQTVVKAATDRADARKSAFRRIEGIMLTPPAGTTIPVPKGVDTDAACAYACAANSACKALDFIPESKTCRLLREVRTDMVSAAPGHITAVEDGEGTLAEALKRAGAPKPKAMLAFPGIDIGGDIIAREASAGTDACQRACFNDAACVAATYADQFCTRFSTVGGMDPRPGSDAHVDVRQTALVARMQAIASMAPAAAPPGNAPIQLGPQPPPAADPNAPVPPGGIDEAEPFDGYDLTGTVLASDLARTARFAEACEAACQDTQACIAYSFSAADSRCRLMAGVSDIAAAPGVSSGILKSAGFQSLEAVRRKLSARENNRAIFRPMPNGCAPTGQAALTHYQTQEQCSFACESSGSCQAWVFTPRDRTCHHLTGISGAVGGIDVRASVLDPGGRRVRELAQACGPLPPAAIGDAPPRPANGGGFFRLPF